MTSFLDQARVFATEAHEGQIYDVDEGLDYTHHLNAVVGVLKDFQEELTPPLDPDTFIKLCAAGWLHDVIEDTPVTREQIQVWFGFSVANLVWCVTGVGATRKDRNASIYDKIRCYPRSAALKLADRIANVEHSATGSKHRLMYARELPEFEAVIRPHVPPAMWQRLERAVVAQ